MERMKAIQTGRLCGLARPSDVGDIMLSRFTDIQPGKARLGSATHKKSGFGVEGGATELVPYTVTSHVTEFFHGQDWDRPSSLSARVVVLRNVFP